ncbi:2,3-bisphosphoglycerate-independent phosphoglycerate mutase [Patescibacteria group bacterium]|nr:2,3-bisphosphoglycerate-independent phosphoglycerate mutase [Patescibacteria group bacterium]
MITNSNKIKPVVLIILDGFGVAPPSQGNAISLAKMPVFNQLVNAYPSMVIQSSGEAVGLSWGEPGNSEVGHLNIGAGKIVWQSLPMINQAIIDNSFFSNKEFLQAINHAKENNSDLHLMGLISNGNIHSSLNHLYALLEMAKKNNFTRVYIHAILDGRDSPRDSAQRFINDVLDKIKSIGVGQIATLSGRFWAMDRDNRWDRIEVSYLAIVKGLAEKEYTDPLKAIQESYKQEVYDEQLKPVVIKKEINQESFKIKDNDAVIFFNFRADRARELTRALVLDDFKQFKTIKIKNLFFCTMTEYEQDLPVKIAFPSVRIENPLAKVISDKGLKQMHIAETEKYAHVTFFLNGGREQAFDGEDRKLIPSPGISSYDAKPAMSAYEILHQALFSIDSQKYKFVAINFANPDMVSHTGNLPATIEALESLDEILGQIVDISLKNNTAVLITSDHGNAEVLVNLRTGEIDKEHNNNPVPLIIIDNSLKKEDALLSQVDLNTMTPSGVLADIAPTILKIMGIDKPDEMTGTPLI